MTSCLTTYGSKLCSGRNKAKPHVQQHGVWLPPYKLTVCSVTKWVHLHGGDAALQALFGEISRMLVPGGIFVLEPQPWRSYKEATKKLVSSCG